MKALRDVFGDTLVSLGATNPNLVVLDADLANSTKADKFAKMYPGRFLQMGIAEQNFVGVAVGLASLDFVPWLSTFTVFFTHRAIRSDPHVSRPDPRRCLPRCHLRFREQWYPSLTCEKTTYLTNTFRFVQSPPPAIIAIIWPVRSLLDAAPEVRLKRNRFAVH
jgi:hypothetical protein